LRRRIEIEVMQTLTACALAHAGAGVAVVDGFSMIRPAWPGLAVCRFTPPVLIIARLLQARLRPLSRLAQSFVAELQAVIAAHAAEGRLLLPPFGPNA
jgi:DNA-binding transcriptional LysR family regulator